MIRKEKIRKEKNVYDGVSTYIYYYNKLLIILICLIYMKSFHTSGKIFHSDIFDYFKCIHISIFANFSKIIILE